MKGHLRSSVLRGAAAADQRRGFTDTSAHGGLNARLSDAVVEEYLRATDRTYAHSVFCAEADLAAGNRSSDDELKEMMGSANLQHESVLSDLVRRRCGTTHLGLKNTAVQASVRGTIDGLEQKLAQVDEEHRSLTTTLQQSTSVRLSHCLQEIEQAARDRAAEEAHTMFERWRDQEIRTIRESIEAQSRNMLDSKVADLHRANSLMRSQLQSEQLKAQQLSREAQIKITAVDSEKADLARIVQMREESLLQAHRELEKSRTEARHLRDRVIDLERESNAAEERTREAQHTLALREADVRALQLAREQAMQRTAARYESLQQLTEDAARSASTSERGALLATNEISTLHAQLHTALERLARLEVTRDAMYPLARPSDTSPEARRAAAHQVKSTHEPRDVQEAGHQPPETPSFQEASVPQGSAPQTQHDVDEEHSPRVTTPVTSHETPGHRYGNSSTSQSSRLSNTDPFERSSSAMSHHTPVGQPQPRAVASDAENTQSALDHKASDNDGEYSRKMSSVDGEDLQKQAMREQQEAWLRQETDLLSEYRGGLQTDFESFSNAIRSALEVEPSERAAALERQRSRVEQEYRQKREQAIEEGVSADAPASGPLKRDSDDDDVDSVDMFGSSSGGSEW